jgi:hypothetical protein
VKRPILLGLIASGGLVAITTIRFTASGQLHADPEGGIVVSSTLSDASIVDSETVVSTPIRPNGLAPASGSPSLPSALSNTISATEPADPESLFSLSMVGDAVEGYTVSEQGEF